MEKKVKVFREGDTLKLEISLKIGETSKIEVKKDFEEVKNELENLKIPVVVCSNNHNNIVVEDHVDGFLIRTSKGIYDINIPKTEKEG